MPKPSAILPVNSNLLKQNTDPLLFLLPWHSSARSYSKGPHSEVRHHRFSYFLLSNLLLVYACKYSEYNPKPPPYRIFLSSHLIYLCIIVSSNLRSFTGRQVNKLPHICTHPYQVFACKILISVLPHSTCLHTKYPYLHYFTPCVANKALISALFHIHSVKLRSLSSAPYGLFRGTSCCETSLDRPICYRALRSLLPQSPAVCT